MDSVREREIRELMRLGRMPRYAAEAVLSHSGSKLAQVKNQLRQGLDKHIGTQERARGDFRRFVRIANRAGHPTFSTETPIGKTYLERMGSSLNERKRTSKPRQFKRPHVR
ncbi:MAG: hypothetical protein HZB67_01225 [Candidatus Aenigmarchaeota archaeon]|nr:hypothetical protein [Candidatus Aenigmarchaeota archaeon]